MITRRPVLTAAIPPLVDAAKCLLTAIAVACSLMILIAAIPTRYINNNIKQSAVILINEGEVPQHSRKLPGSKIDNFTGSVMLNTAAFPSEQNIVYNAFAAPRANYNRLNQPANLFFASTDSAPAAAEIIEYPRYWHGYLVTLKPLLILFNINEIRLINLLTQTLLLIAVCFLAAKRLNLKYALSFLTAILFLNPLSMAISLPYAGVYFIMLITCIAVLRSNTQTSFYKIFFQTGIATAFIDLLSAPLITLGFPLIFYINLYTNSLKTGLSRLISLSASWSIGYLSFWFSKWIIASLVLHKNIISEGIHSVLYRTSGNGSAEIGLKDWTFNNAVTRNLHELNIWLALLALLLYALIIALSYKHTRYIFIKSCRAVFTLLIGLYPFIWYLIVTNHSIIHPLMSYRILAVTVFALTAALAASTQNIKEPKFSHNAKKNFANCKKSAI